MTSWKENITDALKSIDRNKYSDMDEYEDRLEDFLITKYDGLTIEMRHKIISLFIETNGEAEIEIVYMLKTT